MGCSSSAARAFAAALATAWSAHTMAAAPEPAAPAALIPAEAFFDNAQMSDPVMSPGGTALAILVRNNAGRRQIAVIDLLDLRKINIAAGFQDVDVSRVEWVNDTRLVFQTWHEEESAYRQKGASLYAVDRTGDNQRLLVRPNWNAPMTTGSSIVSHALDPNHTLNRTLADGSDDVVIEKLITTQAAGLAGGGFYTDRDAIPLRLDTRTGLAHSMLAGKPPEHANYWLVDDHGRVVGAMTQFEGESALSVPDGAGWMERARFKSFDPQEASFSVRGVGADGRVYVTQSRGQAGTQTLFRLDMASGHPEPDPIVSLQGFDFEGTLIQDSRRHRIIGVHYDSDAEGSAWFDPEFAALQAKVDARLPGLINRIDPASCGCASRVLVTSHSDRQPSLFFLYDRGNDTLIPLGGARPAIATARMADTDFVRIKARDGLDLPVYITKPHGKGPWPTVVLVHGGPFLRGWDWAWDGESQFLASRGYLVVKPEFRGSEGYGRALFVAGMRQWGLAMQDDIADTTRWAAAQGLADPQRTCIAGASYGGYATLMGLVRYGDLYRCGVAWAAVSDISLMHDLWWSDLDGEWRDYGMPTMVGDPVKDADQLVATSPLKQAARITRPLLLAHGGVDLRVPLEQGTAMRDALLANHAPLTWILYPDEAHGWYRPETRADFYRQVEKFLATNLGAAPTPTPTPAAR